MVYLAISAFELVVELDITIGKPITKSIVIVP